MNIASAPPPGEVTVTVPEFTMQPPGGAVSVVVIVCELVTHCARAGESGQVKLLKSNGKATSATNEAPPDGTEDGR
jgi:hypothetical protein